MGSNGKIETIADLRQDPDNARTHTARGVGLIEDALNEVGAARSIVIDELGVVLAGNATVEAAAAAGIERVKVVDADGEELVAVRRTGLSDSAKKRLALYDNRASELSDWSGEMLAELQREDEALLAGLFRDDELEEILGDLMDDPPADPGAQIDKAAELQEKWQVERGQVWEVGRHRIMCGDSTSAEDVGRLMGGERVDCIVSDPPYGVDYTGGTTERDKLKGDDSPRLYLPALTTWRHFCADHVALYLWYADGDQAVAQAVAQAGYHVRRNLIWNKNQAQYGALSQQYKQKHEPFLYCHLKGKSPYWAGDGTEVTVWDVDRATRNELHPTQKPPDLFARAIRNSSKSGDSIFDGFLGSGTTLVACEQTGRIGYGMEIEARYCSVALERLTGMGLEASLWEA